MKNTRTTKKSASQMGLVFTSSNPNDYPIVYSNDSWDVITTSEDDSALKEALGGQTGSYGQDEINRALAKKMPPEQVQANWTQTNENAKDFIKNKPTIPNFNVANDGNQYAITSSGLEVVRPQVFKKTLTSLEDTMLDFRLIAVQIVSELPDLPDENTLYLIPE